MPLKEREAVSKISNRSGLIFRLKAPFNSNKSVFDPAARTANLPSKSRPKESGASTNVRRASLPLGPMPTSVSVSVFW